LPVLFGAAWAINLPHLGNDFRPCPILQGQVHHGEDSQNHDWFHGRLSKMAMASRQQITAATKTHQNLGIKKPPVISQEATFALCFCTAVRVTSRFG
jgi:hypothetical protein